MDYRWSWVMNVLFGSLIPVLLRWLLSLDFEISSFDIKDFVFAGLAMNLTNLTMVNNRMEHQWISWLSGMFIIFLSVSLGLFFFEESMKLTKDFSGMKRLSMIFFGGSTLLSYVAHWRVHTTLNKK